MISSRVQLLVPLLVLLRVDVYFLVVEVVFLQMISPVSSRSGLSQTSSRASQFSSSAFTVFRLFPSVLIHFASSRSRSSRCSPSAFLLFFTLPDPLPSPEVPVLLRRHCCLNLMPVPRHCHSNLTSLPRCCYCSNSSWLGMHLLPTGPSSLHFPSAPVPPPGSSCSCCSPFRRCPDIAARAIVLLPPQRRSSIPLESAFGSFPCAPVSPFPLSGGKHLGQLAMNLLDRLLFSNEPVRPSPAFPCSSCPSTRHFPFNRDRERCK